MKNFSSLDDLNLIKIEDVIKKKRYLYFKNLSIISEAIHSKQKHYAENTEREEILSNFDKSLTDSLNAIIRVRNTYSDHTIGQIESLFHIYSGRAPLSETFKHSCHIA